MKRNSIARINSCFILFMGISFSGFGQSEKKLGSWYIYNGFFNFNPKVELFFETQLRTWEATSNPEVFFLRPYFNYNITQNIQTGLGLEYHKNWTYDEIPDNKEGSEEYRITLQTMLFHNLGRVSIQHRYRYEFRFIEGDKLQRTRYRLQVTVPLSNKTLQKGTIFMNVFNEFLIDTKPNLQINQNRSYFAGGYQLTDNLNLQLGYMLILRSISAHHRLQFFLTHKLFFFEK